MTVLPTEKTPPSLSPDRAKILIYGAPKVGKSTAANALNPDHTLFIATEPGLDGLEVFKTEVRDWRKFREVGAELAEGKHDYTTIAIDTVDALHKMCSDYICEKLDIDYPGDLEFGKGWRAVADEFALRIGKLTDLGGVIFISHAKEVEIKRRVGTTTKMVPDITGAAREWLVGFVDYILYAGIEQTADGESRFIRTTAAENYEAGARGIPLPDPLPLDGEALLKAMEEASAQLGQRAGTTRTPPSNGAEAKPKAAKAKEAAKT